MLPRNSKERHLHFSIEFLKSLILPISSIFPLSMAIFQLSAPNPVSGKNVSNCQSKFLLKNNFRYNFFQMKKCLKPSTLNKSIFPKCDRIPVPAIKSQYFIYSVALLYRSSSGPGFSPTTLLALPPSFQPSSARLPTYQLCYLSNFK